MKKQDMKALGAMGGKSNVEKNGKKHMARLALLGAKARWSKVKDNQTVDN